MWDEFPEVAEETQPTFCALIFRGVESSVFGSKSGYANGSITGECLKLRFFRIDYSTDAETLWNGFRLGVFALKAGDKVKAFLFARGVECESHTAEPFNVKQMMQTFVDAGGEILACGTCLKLRNSQGTELCPLSTMKDLHEIVHDSDKVLTF